MSVLTLHPLLRYSQHDVVPGHCCSIIWDLREAPIAVRHVTSLGTPIDELEFSEHAITPPVSSLHIQCDILPEPWPIEASNPYGVTIRDVLQAIYVCLQKQLRHEEWDRMSEKHRGRISQIFDARWRVAVEPARVHDQGVLRVDCVLRHTWFGGLTVSPESGDSCILTLRCPR